MLVRKASSSERRLGPGSAPFAAALLRRMASTRPPSRISAAATSTNGFRYQGLAASAGALGSAAPGAAAAWRIRRRTGGGDCGGLLGLELLQAILQLLELAVLHLDQALPVGILLLQFGDPRLQFLDLRGARGKVFACLHQFGAQFAAACAGGGAGLRATRLAVARRWNDFKARRRPGRSCCRPRVARRAWAPRGRRKCFVRRRFQPVAARSRAARARRLPAG